MQLVIDASAVARSLSQVAADPDQAEVFIEAVEVTRLGPTGSPQVRRESGFAVRVRDQQRLRMASEDSLDTAAFERAFRSVASVRPQAPYRAPEGRCEWGDDPSTATLRDFRRQLKAGLARRQVSVDYGLSVEHFRRTILVVGTQVTQPEQTEDFYSFRIDLPWGSLGRLSVSLDQSVCDQVERLVAAAVRSASAGAIPSGRTNLLLSPQVAGVLFHEAVGHALEADVLARTGAVDGARGVPLANSILSVLDDPGAGLEAVARGTDDEGSPVCRRWLVRRGVVEEAVADSRWANLVETLRAGSGRVSDRHQHPAPRIHHLVVLPGNTSWNEMLVAAEGGWFVPEVVSGHLDAHSGVVEMVFGWGRRVEGGKIGAAVGRFRLRMHLGELLTQVALLGDRASFSGAGWCAKDGHRLPVWATTPAVLLRDVEVEPCLS